MAPPLRSIARLLPLFLLAGAALPGRAGPVPGGEIVLRERLVLPPVGRAGRSPVHVDPVEARIVAGDWTAPKAGEQVPSVGGAARAWTAARAGADGWVQHPALGGGYAFWTV